MILPKGHSDKYLKDYRDGKIPMGLGLDCVLDDNFLHKHGQLNFILGHDNVGKTYFIEWYFLALAMAHGLTFTLFMDENHAGKVFRDLIQMYMGKKFMEMTESEIQQGTEFMERHFKLIDNTNRYTPTELIKLFKESNTDIQLIDPFNGLKTPLQYGSNYDVLNELKMYTKTTNKTIYINAHPTSASGRRMAEYPKDHDWAGHIMPPVKADIEGGKPFANKADDFLICHRLTKHSNLWKYTMIEVDKIKDSDTGGKPTNLGIPIMIDYNYGLGFIVGGVDVLARERKKVALPEKKESAINAFRILE